MKHWNLDIFGHWVIGEVAKLKWTCNLAPLLQIVPKDYWKLIHLLIPINWPSLAISWVVVQKIYSKMHLVSCNNTHCDVTDLVNHGMVKNIKTWISCGQNIICFRRHILRSCHFVAEVTFNLRVEICYESIWISCVIITHIRKYWHTVPLIVKWGWSH